MTRDVRRPGRHGGTQLHRRDGGIALPSPRPTTVQTWRPPAGGEGADPCVRSATHPRAYETMAAHRGYLFGSFRLLIDGGPVESVPRRKKAKAVLQWFLLNRGKVVSADELIELFWPEATPERGMGNFHVTMHCLRRMLDPDLGPRQESTFIIRHANNFYSFDPGALWWTDVADVDLLFARGQEAELLQDHQRAAFYYRVRSRSPEGCAAIPLPPPSTSRSVTRGSWRAGWSSTGCRSGRRGSSTPRSTLRGIPSPSTEERPIVAYSLELAERVRSALAPLPSVREVPMFGGLSFMVNEAMVVSVGSVGGLLVRVDPQRDDEYLGVEGAAPAEMGTGRTMGKGWLAVAADALGTDEDLAFWIGAALEFNRGAGAPRPRRTRKPKAAR